MVLMRVPKDLILNREAVWEHAKVDVHLRGVLEGVGEFGKVCFESVVFCIVSPVAEGMECLVLLLLGRLDI